MTSILVKFSQLLNISMVCECVSNARVTPAKEFIVIPAIDAVNQCNTTQHIDLSACSDSAYIEPCDSVHN